MDFNIDLEEGEFIKESEVIEEDRYKEVSPSAAVMIPLAVGLGCIFMFIIVILAIIFQPNETEMSLWSILFLIFIFILGIYGLYNARKEYRFQKEHNIKWR